MQISLASRYVCTMILWVLTGDHTKSVPSVPPPGLILAGLICFQCQVLTTNPTSSGLLERFWHAARAPQVDPWQNQNRPRTREGNSDEGECLILFFRRKKKAKRLGRRMTWSLTTVSLRFSSPDWMHFSLFKFTGWGGGVSECGLQCWIEHGKKEKKKTSTVAEVRTM